MDQMFKAAQLAQLIASDRLPPDAARLRLKNFVAKSYIVTRERSESDGRGTLMFSTGDALSAAVLSQMVDLGGLSKEAMQAAASRLQTWRVGELGPEGEAPAESPAQRLWMEFEAAPAFYVALHVRWTRNKGALNCRAYLSLGEGQYFGKSPEEDVAAVADLLVPITPLVPELAARIERMAKAH